MVIPDWVEKVLSDFEIKEEPYHEVEIADALQAVRKGRGVLSDEEFNGFRAEVSAFLFGGRMGGDSLWNTHFAPFISSKKADGTPFVSPDIKELDAAVVAHWGARASFCPNSVMRARYADLVWDLGRAITAQDRNPEYARIAIDSYLAAADEKRYAIEVAGIQWLGRALGLARTIRDDVRTRRVVDFMFEFYDRIAQSRLAGTWLFLFDDLYGAKFITPDQENRIITNLEAMLAKTADTSASDTGVHLTLDPWGAEAASQRLAQHYQRKNDKPNVERVIRSYATAFAHLASAANPMMAMIWLQPVIERYEQAGLKADAEKLRVAAGEKGKNIASDLKTVSVEVKIPQNEINDLLEYLTGSGDLKTSLLRIAKYFCRSPMMHGSP